MRKSTKLYLAILLICAAGAATVLLLPRFYNRARIDSGRPHIGDQATFTGYTQHIDANGKTSDPQTLKYKIKCTQANGDRCVFEVRQLSSSKINGFPYTITADYAETALDKKTIVHDVNGKLIPRGAFVNGTPFPFHDLLMFPVDYWNGSYRKNQPSKSIGIFTHRSNIKPYDASTITLELYRKKNKATYDERYERQLWRPGDWIWLELSSGYEQRTIGITVFRDDWLAEKRKRLR